MAKTSEAVRRAVRKYDAEKTVQFHLKLNKITDEDVIKRLNEVEGKQSYIKELIRKDIKEEKMKEIILTNEDEIREELTDMIMELDKARRQHHTDIYLYIDEEGKGKLHEFENPGGNSWIDDDHYTLYTDKPHYDDLDMFASNWGEDGYDGDDIETDYAEWVDDNREVYDELANRIVDDFLNGAR